jgi:deoxyribodipyrimidine photo-lyase
MANFNDARVRQANDQPIRKSGKYVLYWMQMYRRLESNHALDYAVAMAKHYDKPLVIYEGLKLHYPWASARFHMFLLTGMAENLEAAAERKLNYWPLVETPGNTGHGLVKELTDDAVMLVTDDYPQYIVPAQIHTISAKAACRVVAVDGNSVTPLSLLGKPTAAAAHLRPKWHKLFAEAWANRSNPKPDLESVSKPVKAPFKTWTVPKNLREFVESLPIDQSVPEVQHWVGGATAGHAQLKHFVKHKLPKYADERSQPDDPKKNSASGLSAHLHYGHLSIDDVIAAVLGKDWTPDQLNLKTRNRDDFFCRNANVNSYLDEAVTWRDVGYQWHFARISDFGFRISEKTKNKTWQEEGEEPSFNFETFDFSPLSKDGTLAGVLPEWALNTLGKHAGDRREYLYNRAQFEAGTTHDPIWNAAQRELVVTGRIHNYLRMLWAKKVLEWSECPEAAYRVLEHLNNKYAMDGRDPNSYTGILWCFGLFDRPWPPERQVFGNIRFMSSDSTKKKFKLAGYLEFIRNLPTIAEARSGKTTSDRSVTLFDG